MERGASLEEIVFNNIYNSKALYSTQKVYTCYSNRDELLEILKTYRPMKLFEYQYGRNRHDRENSKLFVFEFNDKTKVREYYKNGETWYCRECEHISLIFKYGIIFVKKIHNCISRELSAVMVIQASLGNKEFLGNNVKNFENGSTETSENIKITKNYSEAIFSTIKNSPKQYTKEVITNWDSIKSKILEILETNHPIKLSDYQYGVNRNRRKNFRLIVQEFDNDKTKVRQYLKSGRCWYCCECKVTYRRIMFDYGILFVPRVHNCEPREYALVMSIQNLYKNKKIGSIRNYYTQKRLMENESASTESDEDESENNVTEDELSTTAPSSPELEESSNDNEEEEEDGCIINIPKNHGKALFKTIKNSPKQYTKEVIKKWDSLKSRILRILKNYRPIKLSDYRYGMNQYQGENSRLIVHEFDNDKTKVREYSKNGIYWICCECTRLKINNTKIIIDYGILFVPNDHKCEPREYAVVMSLQNLLKNEKIGSFNYYIMKRRLMEVDSISTESDEDQLEESEDESKNAATEELSATSPTSPELEGSSNDDNEEEDDCIILDGKPPSSKRPHLENNYVETKRTGYTLSGDSSESNVINKLPSTSTNSRLNEINNKNDEDDDCIILEDDNDDVKPSTSKKPQQDQSHENQPQYFVIEKPSTLILKKACAKLDISYSNEAYKLWSKIDIDKIDISLFSSSISTTTVHLDNFKTKNIFELFSLLLTGTSEKYYQIQYCINEAFRQKMINSGKMTLTEFDKIIMSPKITNEQLSFLCKFLPCRIVIFEENYEKRFGKWNSSKNENNEILNFVFSYFNEFYSIVLKV